MQRVSLRLLWNTEMRINLNQFFLFSGKSFFPLSPASRERKYDEVMQKSPLKTTSLIKKSDQNHGMSLHPR